jgi:Domain of unknown function (DUF5666)
MHLRGNRLTTLAAVAMGLSFSMAPAAGAGMRGAAAAQTAAAITRALGSITAIQGNEITIKTDSGAQVSVAVQDSTRILRIEPGQKTLQGATPVQLQDLQVGDRVLAAGKTPEGSAPLAASSILLMKHSEILQRQQQEQEDWQKRGVGGLVRAVDPAAGTITLSTGSGSTAKAVTVHVSKSTIIRRYAQNSIKFSDTKLGTVDQIRPGDQLEARGDRTPDGSEMTAEEIVSGSFRYIAGTISSMDPSANEISVMDLRTKRPVEVKVTADSQMRKLPQMLAQMIAIRLKGGPGGAPGGQPAAGRQTSKDSSAAGGQQLEGQRAASQGGEGHRFGGSGGPPSFQQLLSRLPAATLGDLQKGDAVMIVSTEAPAPAAVTAITLLSGVEPILTAAPAGSEASILSPWSLSTPSGGDDQGGLGGTP